MSGKLVGILITSIATIIVATVATFGPRMCTDNLSKPSESFVFSGVVVDDAGNGISLAKIQIIGKSESYYTEGDGSFTIRINSASKGENEIRVKIYHEGFDGFDQRFSLPLEGTLISLTKSKK